MLHISRPHTLQYSSQNSTSTQFYNHVSLRILSISITNITCSGWAENVRGNMEGGVGAAEKRITRPVSVPPRSTGLGGSPVCETNGTYFYLSVFAKCDLFVVHYAQPGGDLEAQHSLSEMEVRSLAPCFHFFPAATVIGSIAFFFLSVILWLLRLCLWYLQLL